MFPGFWVGLHDTMWVYQAGKAEKEEFVALLIGTTGGLWELNCAPTGRWRWLGDRPRHMLRGQPVASLASLPEGGTLAMTEHARLWYRLPPEHRWCHLPISLPATHTASGPLRVTALTAAPADRLWIGGAPIRLFSTTITMSPRLAWKACPAMGDLEDAKHWWGPVDAAAPLVTAILLDPRDARSMTVAVAVGGIYHSTDGGATWTPQHAGIVPLVHHMSEHYGAHRNVQRLLRHPLHHDTLYAATESAFYRTSATGDTWTWNDITPPHARESLEVPGDLLPHPQDGNAIFAVLPLVEDASCCTLWQSRDGGAQWEEVHGAPVLPAASHADSMRTIVPQTIRLCASPADPPQLAIVTPHGDVLVSSPGDFTAWQRKATRLGVVTSVGWTEE
jgi:hypothetical protein